MITAEPFVICSRCSERTPRYYNDYGSNGKLCVDCLVELHDGNFPTGKGVSLPCDKCHAPNIKWYHRATYGMIFNDCGNHENRVNHGTMTGITKESEDDATFDWDS